MSRLRPFRRCILLIINYSLFIFNWFVFPSERSDEGTTNYLSVLIIGRFLTSVRNDSKIARAATLNSCAKVFE